MSKVETVKQLLREYQNEVIEYYDLMITDGHSQHEIEDNLIKLDEEYAERIIGHVE